MISLHHLTNEALDPLGSCVYCNALPTCQRPTPFDELPSNTVHQPQGRGLAIPRWNLDNRAQENSEDLLSVVALRHAAAFLGAYFAEDDGTDSQTIFLAFLVVLQHQDVHIRRAASDCISCLCHLADHQFSTVYRFDTIWPA